MADQEDQNEVVHLAPAPSVDAARPIQASVIEKALIPSIFSHAPSSDNSEQLFRHWMERFTNYINTLSANQAMSEISKKMILVNLVSAEVFELFHDSDTF